MFSALAIGVAKTGLPGLGSFVAPLMVLTVGDARYAAAWTLPILSTADVFAVLFWRKHADARKLFSLIPWVAAGMVAGALALSLSEHVLRRIIGCIVVLMLVVHIVRRRNPQQRVAGSASFYGIVAGFASTIANAAAPVMNMYLLSRKLPKEQFVATGAWFFLVINLAKVPIYLWHHLFSRTSLSFDLLMVFAVVCGVFAGL
ncbi:MAG TPA: sulfite exporter TauE/SafE family protein, partial [Candidatus Angelobacter sp.]|nr:sulfite exporter TauE/SafE family protein [Candidatus Angelobacter sp.]